MPQSLYTIKETQIYGSVLKCFTKYSMPLHFKDNKQNMEKIKKFSINNHCKLLFLFPIVPKTFTG